MTSRFTHKLCCTLSLLAIWATTAQVLANNAHDDTNGAAASDAVIEVMVLGSVHFKRSNADLINLDTTDILAPVRQQELVLLTERLARFKPTMVVSERVTSAPDYIDPNYQTFTLQELETNRNERAQIAYRLAHHLGLSSVRGIDERPEGDEPAYFPFGAVVAHAEEIGRKDELDAYMNNARQSAEAESARIFALSIPEALAEVNRGRLSSPDFYYDILDFDQGEKQPGAVLNAMWFMRNAKIFAKLQDVTKPGDRVVVVYGAGHKFWLDHLIERTPGYRLVDPVPYLIGEH